MKSFNLIDEAWIPVVGKGRVSLKQVFSDVTLSRLDGSPLEKIAVLKLLQAISQVARTPETDAEWEEMGKDLTSFGKQCLDYLERVRSQFDLYGESPFLQILKVRKAKKYGINTLYPNIASGNNTVWRQEQQPRPIDNGEIALVLLVQMSCGLGGKRHDKGIVLERGYEKRSAHAGPAIDYSGVLHSFCLGRSLLETVWFNTFTLGEIKSMTRYLDGLGVPPWELMPQSENDEVARKLKESLLGRLVPLSRFCLIEGEDVHLTEGIVHLGYKAKYYDPSAVFFHNATSKGEDPKVIWCQLEKRPWRDLTAICAFLDSQKSETSCEQIRFCWHKLKKIQSELTVWSGGIRVETNSGEQRGIDFIESETTFSPTEDWFLAFKNEMNLLGMALKELKKGIACYVKALHSSEMPTVEKSKKKSEEIASKERKAEREFWQQCERYKQRIIDECEDPQGRRKIHKLVQHLLLNVFDGVCPKETGQQLKAWAFSRPTFAKIY